MEVIVHTQLSTRQEMIQALIQSIRIPIQVDTKASYSAVFIYPHLSFQSLTVGKSRTSPLTINNVSVMNS